MKGLSDRHVAYHESGHFVAYYLLRDGYYKPELSLESSDESLGKTLDTLRLIAMKPGAHGVEDASLDVLDAENQIVADLAGQAAEWRLDPALHGQLLDSAQNDREKALQLAKELRPSEADPLQQYYDRADQLVTKNWERISCLAEALLEKHTIRWDEAYFIIENDLSGYAKHLRRGGGMGAFRKFIESDGSLPYSNYVLRKLELVANERSPEASLVENLLREQKNIGEANSLTGPLGNRIWGELGPEQAFWRATTIEAAARTIFDMAKDTFQIRMPGSFDEAMGHEWDKLMFALLNTITAGFALRSYKEEWFRSMISDAGQKSMDLNAEQVRYPYVKVRLAHMLHGDCFGVMMQVMESLMNEGVDDDVIQEFMSEAAGLEYSELLVLCKKWVTCL